MRALNKDRLDKPVGESNRVSFRGGRGAFAPPWKPVAPP